MDKMGSNINDIVKSKIDALKNADPNQKAIALTVFALIISILVVTTFWMNRVNYKVLYSNLNIHDAGEIVKYLKDKKVNYKLQDDGTSILVPADQVYHLRLELAGTGLPKNGKLGFELFDKSDFQASEFTENIKYLRALQGELMVTINHLEAVEDSKVNLSIPKRSVYLSEGNAPSASVVLKLRSGKTLSEEQIRGITQLVASCAEGMKPENVTVMSTDGKLLSDFIQQGNYGTTTYQLKIQKQIQAQVEQKVKSTLDSVLGPGKSVVNAAVEIKMDKRAVQKETYQPLTGNTGVVRSTQTMLENYDGQGGAAVGAQNRPPVPAVVQNQNQPAPDPNTGNPLYRQQTNTTNYEVSKVIESETINPGQITRLSVGVLIDSSTNLTPQQIADLTAVISSVSGISTQRGDELTVKMIKFTPQELGDEMPPENIYVTLLRKYGALAAAAFSPIMILLVLLVLLRKRKKAELEDVKRKLDTASKQEQGMLLAPGKVDLVAGEQMGPVAGTELYPPIVSTGMGPGGGFGPSYDDVREPQEAIRKYAQDNPRLVAALFEKWISAE